MARSRGRLLGGVVLALMLLHLARGQAQQAEPATVERYIEFRDGSVLRLPVVDEDLTVQVVRPQGRIEALTVRRSALERITFTPERVFEKKKALLVTVAKLGSDDFTEREKAHTDLVKMGASIRHELEAALELFSDQEVRSRLRRLLGDLPKDGKEADAGPPFDTALLVKTKAPLLVDAGEDVPVRLDGKTYRLGRQEVVAVSTGMPENPGLDTLRLVPKGFTRLNRPEDFPRGCWEEGFETAPDGRKLVIGENIEKLFIKKGFTFTTSVQTSHVSVNNYNVDAKTKGLSAATHQPLWEGVITIRFCKPGHENIPAGVTHFGLWIAHVMPNGTAMHAYDFKGRELGVIRTVRTGNDFLAFRSSAPVHSLRIVPNVQIDPNYTLDDFIYTPPQTADVAHPERFSALFEDGQRVACADISCERGTVRLHGLPAGLPDRSRPLQELLRATTPSKAWQELAQPKGLFVELRDGSVIFGAEAPAGKPPVFARWPRALKEPLKEPEDLVALWSTQHPRMELPKDAKPPMVWDPDKKVWQAASNLTWMPDGVQYTTPDGRYTRTFQNLPMLWLARPNPEPDTSWRLRTVQGEEIILSTKNLPAVAGRLSKELAVTWQGDGLRIPLADLVSIYRVPKGP